jgi:hypothetical protein
MKKICTLVLILLVTSTTINAQKTIANKWHQYYIGGKKGFFVKTTTFTNTTMTENQTGRGDKWDNSPVTINVTSINEEANGIEKIITKYGDSSYYVMFFKDFTANEAKVHMSTEEYKTAEDASQMQMPGDKEFSKWLTEAGYKLSLKKPAMPELTKKDVLAIVQKMVDVMKETETRMANLTDDQKKGAGLGMVLLLSTVPSNYAEAKGYNPYKSLPVIERGMNKFKNDKDVKKLMKTIDLKKM